MWKQMNDKVMYKLSNEQFMIYKITNQQILIQTTCNGEKSFSGVLECDISIIND